MSVGDVFAIQQPWDYALYVLMFVQLITLMLVFNSSLRDVLFIAIPIICAFADKAYLFGYVEGGYKDVGSAIDYHTKESFATYVARVAMFAFPLMLTTQTKVKRAAPATAFLAVITGIYVGARWGLQQLPAEQESSVLSPANMLVTAQFGGFYVLAVVLHLRAFRSPRYLELD